MTDIDSMILLIARKCGWITKYRVKKLLKPDPDAVKIWSLKYVNEMILPAILKMQETKG